jgi:hypothetical protein
MVWPVSQRATDVDGGAKTRDPRKDRGAVGELAAGPYGVKGIPHMIIVGRDGKIAAIHVGYSEQAIPILMDEINSAWNKPTLSQDDPPRPGG